MERPGYIPQDYKRIKVVSSLSELFNEQFGGPDGVNCILYPRKLSGDFNALAARMVSKNIDHLIHPEELEKFMGSLNQTERFTAEIVLNDMHKIKEQGWFLNLRIESDKTRLLYNSARKYHMDIGDTAKASMGILLSCYARPVTQWLRNEESDIQPDGYYQAKSGVQDFSFMPGDIWRQAGSGATVPPFIHRAPTLSAGAPPRILIVGL